MSKVFTTEITSDTITSDNPIHQRLYFAYVAAAPYIKGDMLEVGCGEGRGVADLAPMASSFMAIDKNEDIIQKLAAKYPHYTFRQMTIPPLHGIADNSFDVLVSFQVIEHIRDDKTYIKELARVLRPGGIALISTPNRSLSLSRNPWHEREYVPSELETILKPHFTHVNVRGVAGSDKVMAYHERNRASVNKIMKWDVLKLQYRLPAALLRVPYEILNRMNRNKLQESNDELVRSITVNDYMLTDDADSALDLFAIATK